MNRRTILQKGLLPEITPHRRITLGLTCWAVCLSCAIPTSALSASNPGNCASHSGNVPASCQFEVLSYTQAPLPNQSMGIRLDAAVHYVLFNSFPAIGPRFVSNASGNDFFVPQGSVGEFSSFLGSPPSIVTIGYAVEPKTYTATPSPANAACGTPSPSSIDVAVPTTSNSTSPVIVNSYSLVLDPANPSTTQTTVGSTVLEGSPAQFTYTRQDCSTDNQGSKTCTTINFVEDQQLIFSATGSKPNFSWGAPVVTSAIYLNNSPADCGTTAPSSVDGLCGAANGASYTTAPTTGLCNAGNAGAVTTSSGGIWTWTCSGANGGSSQSCTTMETPTSCPTNSVSWNATDTPIGTECYAEIPLTGTIGQTYTLQADPHLNLGSLVGGISGSGSIGLVCKVFVSGSDVEAGWGWDLNNATILCH